MMADAAALRAELVVDGVEDVGEDAAAIDADVDVGGVEALNRQARGIWLAQEASDGLFDLALLSMLLSM